MATVEQKPTISVVIRSCTRSAEIIGLIESLARQSLLPDEVIIIDSGSADLVVERLREWARNGVKGEARSIPLRLKEIPPPEYQSARALNTAIGLAQGELIAILSQDALPVDAFYLERLLKGFDSDRVAGAYARQVMQKKRHPLGEKDLAHTYPPVSRTQAEPDCWFVNTCSMIRRNLWEEHAFDERAVISEDHEWGKWAQGAGYVLKYCAAAVVYHYHPYNRLGELWERHFLEGKGLAYVHGRRQTLRETGLYWVREVASDFVWLLRKRRIWYWPGSLLRRTIKYTALYFGYRVGFKESKGKE